MMRLGREGDLIGYFTEDMGCGWFGLGVWRFEMRFEMR